MNPYVIAEWERAQDSLGIALIGLRDGYYANSISLSYYAILHAAKAALQLYSISAESHSAVRRLFGLHLVNPGLIESQWGREIGDSVDLRISADYDVMMKFDESDARDACERAQAFLDRIRALLGDAISSGDSEALEG